MAKAFALLTYSVINVESQFLNGAEVLVKSSDSSEEQVCLRNKSNKSTSTKKMVQWVLEMDRIVDKVSTGCVV